MPIRKANAQWNGDLKSGNGTMKVESGAFEGKYSFGTRFENEKGTNPEELIGAAHAGCFSMAFSNILASNGFKPNSVKTEAKVHLEKDDSGFSIKKIELSTVGDIPEISNDDFMKYANEAKEGCPVSRLLTGAEIKLDAKLMQSA